jgi:hydrogenase expression/formation protein HypC
MTAADLPAPGIGPPAVADLPAADPAAADAAVADSAAADSAVASSAAEVPECHDEVCITCSDTAVTVRIVRLLEDELAVVDTGSGEEEVSIALVSATIGDLILVHAAEAIAVVQP